MCVVRLTPFSQTVVSRKATRGCHRCHLREGEVVGKRSRLVLAGRARRIGLIILICILFHHHGDRRAEGLVPLIPGLPRRDKVGHPVEFTKAVVEVNGRL